MVKGMVEKEMAEEEEEEEEEAAGKALYEAEATRLSQHSGPPTEEREGDAENALDDEEEGVCYEEEGVSDEEEDVSDAGLGEMECSARAHDAAADDDDAGALRNGGIH